jgi:hypothetical protein
MVRLDRTIGFPKPVLTGQFGLMVRSSRTMTIRGGRHAIAQLILAPVGLDPMGAGP